MGSSGSTVGSGPSPLVAGLVAAACAALIYLQVYAGKTVDATTVALVGIALVPWLFRYISTFKAGPDGIEFTRLVETVQQVSQQVEENRSSIEAVGATAAQAQETAQVAQTVATTGVGKRPTPQLAVAGAAPESAAAAMVEPLVNDDPVKGQFGGKSTDGGRTLTASVRPLPNDANLFRVELDVRGTSTPMPDGTRVVFHLHPTFTPSTVRVVAKDGVARLSRYAWGAFTAGAEIQSENVRLELDLADLPDAPAVFRER